MLQADDGHVPGELRNVALKNFLIRVQPSSRAKVSTASDNVLTCRAFAMAGMRALIYNALIRGKGEAGSSCQGHMAKSHGAGGNMRGWALQVSSKARNFG